MLGKDEDYNTAVSLIKQTNEASTLLLASTPLHHSFFILLLSKLGSEGTSNKKKSVTRKCMYVEELLYKLNTA